MKILLTGATGYIGKSLLPVLLAQGHEIICCVRDRNRFYVHEAYRERITVLEVDFSRPVETDDTCRGIDAAFYLIHSMAASIDEFREIEQRTAEHFVHFVEGIGTRQIIYLSGLMSDDRKLSRHLESRLNVEKVLKSGRIPVTILRAGIIVGSGSASFEIIRDLVEKLPFMITPSWLHTRCQPIAVSDVTSFLTGVLLRRECLDEIFDIGGKDQLTYREMLLGYAEVRGLRRVIWTLPVMTPRLSSYWLYFITAVSYKLAVNLVNSMKIDLICSDNRLPEILGLEPVDYRTAVRQTFDLIDRAVTTSSWKDAMSSSTPGLRIRDFIQVPTHGCFRDSQRIPIHSERKKVLENIWSIGGERGWFYADFLWALRGFIDKLFGGVGLRRGRTNPTDIHAGDALDFWRVILADRDTGRLLLYAEMKLPGEAWLEFQIENEQSMDYLVQTATFRPSGLLGRLYWYLLFPFHVFIFRNMARNIVRLGHRR